VRTPTGFSALPVVSPEGEPTSAVMCSATRSMSSSWHFAITESWIALLYFFVHTGGASAQNRHFSEIF